MTLRHKLETPSVQLRMGLVFLIIASLSKWFLESRPVLSDTWGDGIVGLLYGMAIGLMLLGIWRNSHRNRLDQ